MQTKYDKPLMDRYFPSSYTGSERNPRLLEISLEIPLGVLAVQPTRADWLDNVRALEFLEMYMLR